MATGLLSISLVGDRALVLRLQATQSHLMAALKPKVTALTLKLQRHIVEDKLSGQVLKVRTGALRRSIRYKVTATQTAVWGRVFSSGDVKYAAIHEFGGTIDHPGGTAYFIDKATGLARFVANADERAATLPRTKAHKIPMPARSFMRTALADQRPGIDEALRQTALEVLNRTVHG